MLLSAAAAASAAALSNCQRPTHKMPPAAEAPVGTIPVQHRYTGFITQLRAHRSPASAGVSVSVCHAKLAQEGRQINWAQRTVAQSAGPPLGMLAAAILTGAALLGGTHAAIAGSYAFLPPPDLTAAVATAAEAAFTPADVSLDAAQSGSRAEDGPRVWLDVEVDGQAWGRVHVQLYGDVPTGAARFADLAKGIEGVGYKRSKVDFVNASYIRSNALRRLSYTSDVDSPIAGGDTVDELEVEMQLPDRHHHQRPGDVSLIVRDAKLRETKEKLVAYRGKLVSVQEATGESPNGSGFVITLGPAPGLDSTNLVVGRVVEGLELVQRISALPSVKDNTDYGYFKTAKMIGDKRATVAEKGFGRPFKRVMFSNSGCFE